jgi:hypothetical protein
MPKLQRTNHRNERSKELSNYEKLFYGVPFNEMDIDEITLCNDDDTDDKEYDDLT